LAQLLVGDIRMKNRVKLIYYSGSRKIEKTFFFVENCLDFVDAMSLNSFEVQFFKK